MAFKNGRKVHIDSVEYEYAIGDGTVVINLPKGGKHVATWSQVTGFSEDQIKDYLLWSGECGCPQERANYNEDDAGVVYFDLSPSVIKAYIQKIYMENYHECRRSYTN